MPLGSEGAKKRRCKPLFFIRTKNKRCQPRRGPKGPEDCSTMDFLLESDPCSLPYFVLPREAGRPQRRSLETTKVLKNGGPRRGQVYSRRNIASEAKRASLWGSCGQLSPAAPHFLKLLVFQVTEAEAGQHCLPCCPFLEA